MKKSHGRGKSALEERVATTVREVQAYVTGGGSLGVIQAPPGSGKTWLLVAAAKEARKAKMRVAIAAQTNSQADEICKRLAAQVNKSRIVRFAGGGSTPLDLCSNVDWTTDARQLPTGPVIVVGTTAKWGLVGLGEAYDVLLVDEAWQMSWADFSLLAGVSANFILIGDPGQIPPVVTIEVSRWETAPRAPHVAAPKSLLEDPSIDATRWDLPATRRLPADTADLVRPFYDFPFDSFAGPGERYVAVNGKGSKPVDLALDLLRAGSVVGVTIPTPDSGPPLEQDDEVASAAAKIISDLLRRGARVKCDNQEIDLSPGMIGISSTHRTMNTALDLALPKKLRGLVHVDTPERWQGLERPIMLIVHPLSGTERPSTFDLETGRLCVMASRHMAGMIVLTRDHIGSTLASAIPSAGQPFGKKDVEGRGLRDNVEFWGQLERAGRIVGL